MQEIIFATNTLDGGGIERAFVNLMKAIDHKGERIKLILCKKQGIFVDQVPEKIKIINLNCRLRTSFIKFYNNLKGVPPGTPVICAPQFVCLTLILVNFFLRKKLRIIVTHHGLDDRDVKELGFIGMLEKGLIRRLYKHAFAIVAVSDGVRSYLTDKLNVPSSKVTAIYNPVVTPDIATQAEEEIDDVFMKQALQEKVPLLVSVGRLGMVKRFDILIHSFAMLIENTPAKLVIVGDGPERNNLEVLIRKLGLREHAHITGFKQNPYPYISHSTVFVSSSESESLGIALLEALYLKTKVVATKTTGALEVLNNGEFGLLANCGDIESLSNALRIAISASVEMGSRLENWLRKFEVVTISRQYKELIEAARRE